MSLNLLQKKIKKKKIGICLILGRIRIRIKMKRIRIKMKRIRNTESSIIFRFCNPLHKKKINVLILFMYIVQDEQKFLVNNSRRINPCFRT